MCSYIRQYVPTYEQVALHHAILHSHIYVAIVATTNELGRPKLLPNTTEGITCSARLFMMPFTELIMHNYVDVMCESNKLPAPAIVTDVSLAHASPIRNVNDASALCHHH